MGAAASLEFLEGFVGDKINQIDGTALRFFIPFASNGSTAITTDNAGAPLKCTPLGFSSYSVAQVTANADGSFDLPIGAVNTATRAAAFTVPLDCAIDSIYVSVNLGASGNYTGGINAMPGVVVYKATSGQNMFYPISATETLVGGFSGNETTIGKLNDESTTGLNVIVNAGDRLMVVAIIRATGNSGSVSFTGAFSVGVAFKAAGVTDPIPPAIPVTANTASLQNYNMEPLYSYDGATILVTFPNSSILGSGYMLSSEATTVTILRTGTYQISYRVSGDIPEGTQFDVLFGTEETDSLRRKALATGEVSCTSVLPITAPKDLSLRAMRESLESLTLSEGVGAELNITQIA